MAKRRLSPAPLLLCLGLWLASAPFLASEESLHEVWAVKDCRVVTPGGPVLPKATVIIRGGLIESVGAETAIPPDAEVIDGSALTLHPGLIDGLGQSLLKLPEEKFDPAKFYSGEFTDKDRGLTPELRAFDFAVLGKATLEKHHKFGLTAVQAIPSKGVLSGQASLFSLSSEDKNKALVLKDTWLGLGYSPASFMVYPNSLMGVVAFFRQEFADIGRYGLSADLWAKTPRGLRRPPYNGRWDILREYASGKKPVVFFCNNQHDIRRSLALAEELKLDYFLCDLGGEAQRVIPELKKAKARVLCTVAFKAPATSRYSQLGKAEKEKAEKEFYPRNPAALASAGIPFAFSSLGTDDPKSFMEGVQKALEAGLAPDKALEALTSAPAAFLGLDEALGAVEAGRIANLVLIEGDPLAKEPKVKYVFADGRLFDFTKPKAKEGEKPTVNVSGRWELSLPEAGLTLTVDFAQEEASLSGKMTTPFGAFDFTGGSVSADQIYFEVNASVGGQDIDLYFSAAVTGDTMRGTAVQGTSGSTEFTGKRNPA
ncbi:MAG TPA: amidohydrolase family protein [Candidatus Aminicenantes bacterium]|nr:amidohydrolase family protein [Candidatus Aminicenantes bacterium]HOS12270.1 amidohydrolase family protein [Candidatus Aminicenantes bacterium]HPL14906.1 amidohydrolase family protein [Candidatus Aminicenantes bacterium]